jgi:hypothetical protein
VTDLTEGQRVERGRRAQAAWDEFLKPALEEIRNAYGDRIVEIAATELSRDKRTDKLTALSTALRILGQVEGGLQAIIVDGQVAHQSKLRAGEIEKLSSARRRFLDMVPH